jgi:hypothetical protein
MASKAGPQDHVPDQEDISRQRRSMYNAKMTVYAARVRAGTERFLGETYGSGCDTTHPAAWITSVRGMQLTGVDLSP